MPNEELTLSILRKIDTLQNQKSLSTELGYSIGKINYVLKALMGKGLIKAESFFANKNKNQYQYLLTPEGIETKLTLTKHFIEKKKREYDELLLEVQMMEKEQSKGTNI